MKQFLIVLLFINLSYAQKLKLKGQVICNSQSLGDIAIYNLSQKTLTFTNEKGEFEIDVELGD